MMSNDYKIEAVLFDMDGVLLDSERYIRQAGIEMFKEKGYQVAPEDFLPFTGMGENKYLGGVAAKNNIPFELDRDKARTYEIYAELVEGRLEPLDGVLGFIEQCSRRGLKMAVASSADPIKIEINLAEIGIPVRTFQAIISGLDITHKKPSPDIFLKAAELVGVDPSECVVFEDADAGVEAAKTAGMHCIAVDNPVSPYKQKLDKADIVVGRLDEITAEMIYKL